MASVACVESERRRSERVLKDMLAVQLLEILFFVDLEQQFGDCW